MRKRISTDICIIGAGSAGLTLAAGAAQLGRKVVLIERGKMGGDCLNYGCVPSKALLAAASHAAEIAKARAFGVHTAETTVDFKAVMDHVHSVIAAIAPHDSQERFEGLGVTVIREPATFTSPREALAGDTVVRAKHFVIATGSSALIPEIPGLQSVPYFTNETIFENRVRPERLIIIGGGPVGVEMAQAHRRLGSEVVLIEGASILGREDAEAVAVLRTALGAEGITLHEGASAKSVRTEGSKIVVDMGSERAAGSHLFVAAGRRANIEGLGLDAARVIVKERTIEVNARLQTSNPRIYAIGDAAGGAQYTHLAGDHASTLVRSIIFKMPARRRDHLAPRAVYTDPELAAIGLSETEAKAQDPKARVVRWTFHHNDRALAERRDEGFAKVVCDSKGRILGATIIGKGAGDLIHLYALAIANKMKIGAFTNYIAPYPTRGEVAKRAAGAWYTPALFSSRTRMVARLLAIFD